MMWIHDISQSALAAAVLTLGLVILLELRSIMRLRQAVDGSLARVFEQLDLLRFENQQLIDAQARPSGTNSRVAHGTRATPARAPGSSGVNPYENANRTTAVEATPITQDLTSRTGVPAGEARLLASLAAARARRAPPRNKPVDTGAPSKAPSSSAALLVANNARSRARTSLRV